MIIGDTSIVAIESVMIRAYERLSLRAFGFFVIYIGGVCYGRRKRNATFLACSFDEVNRRLADRGKHTAFFATDYAAKNIAWAVRDACCSNEPAERVFGMSHSEFETLVHSSDLMWAPDGDAAFDDGSHVLQFDVGDRVRVIAYKVSDTGHTYDSKTLRDIWLPADTYYGRLREWSDAFEAEWARAAKIPLGDEEITVFDVQGDKKDGDVAR